MRAFSRVLAGLIALALVVGGVLLVVEVAVAALSRSPWLVPWDRWWRSAQTQPWSDGDTRLVALLLLALGLLLLLVTLSRWRPVSLALSREPGMPDGDVRRASLESALARHAESVDGVDRASVKVVGSKARVRVDSNRRDPGDLGARVERQVAERLDAVSLASPPRVAVDVRPRED